MLPALRMLAVHSCAKLHSILPSCAQLAMAEPYAVSAGRSVPSMQNPAPVSTIAAPVVGPQEDLKDSAASIANGTTPSLVRPSDAPSTITSSHQSVPVGICA